MLKLITRVEALRLLFIAFMLAFLDTMQSYWLQHKLVSPFSEVNLLPLTFFKYGFWGYVAYLPIDMAGIYVILVAFWLPATLIFSKPLNTKSGLKKD